MKRILLSIALFISASTFGQAPNNAIQFDGVNDIATTANASGLVVGGDGISISCWAYLQNPTPQTTSYDGIIGLRDNATADFYMLHYSASTLECRFRNDAGTNFDLTPGGITLNTWQHFVLTYDGTMLRFYRNGIRTDSIAASGTISSTSGTFYMGGLPYQTFMFNLQGKTDEVSLWNRALSEGEISCMGSNGIDTAALGLELYYKFNQGVANGANAGLTNVIDSKGNANATLANLALSGVTSNWVPGATAGTATTGFLCPQGTYTFGTQTLNAPGNYSDTLTNVNGCDSIVQLTLYQAVVDTLVNQGFGGTFTANVTGNYYQWLDCNNGYAPIAGATSKSFTPSANGSYAVIVQQGSCRDTSGCHTITNVGVAEFGTAQLASIRQDNANGIAYVQFEKTTNSAIIRLMDLSGKILLTRRHDGSAQSRIDLNEFSAGVYMLSVEDNGSHQVFRIVNK